MSYITIPRIGFSGFWQADVSTVNNDVGHYDNTTFQPSYQQPMTREAMNGWWNPDGTGSFRMYDMSIRFASKDLADDPAADPAVGLYLTPQQARSSAKMVDLDPEMQAVSMIFGLRVVLTDGTTDYLSADFEPTPFRDYLNGQYTPNANPNRTTFASALYTSTLSNVQWHAKADVSPTLMALKTAAAENDNRLSMSFIVCGFGFPGMPQFGGKLVGAIGTYQAGDPQQFVAGRRMDYVPIAGSKIPFGDFTADINQANTALSMDLGMCLPLEANGSGSFRVVDVGEIYAAVLKDTDTVSGLGTPQGKVDVGVQPGTMLDPGQLKLLGEIDYSADDWLDASLGIVDMALDTEAQQLLKVTLQDDGLCASHPLAIVRKQGHQYQVVIRENFGGLYTRADQFVFRVDPCLEGMTQIPVRFSTTQWGQPVSHVPIELSMEPAGPGAYWATGSTVVPQAQIPALNTPPDKIQYPPGVRSADGWAQVSFGVANPGNPHGYVDGQIYTFKYKMKLANASSQAPLDLIVVHAREAQNYTSPPDWDTEIKPFMQQYDNLYPIMSKHLFSLSDPDVLQEHAGLLSLAFSLPESDPNHMPVTRDLSASKRQAVLEWLAQLTGQPAPAMAAATLPAAEDSQTLSDKDIASLPAAPEASVDRLQQTLDGVEDNEFGKNGVVRAYLSAEIERLKNKE